MVDYPWLKMMRMIRKMLLIMSLVISVTSAIENNEEQTDLVAEASETDSVSRST